MKIDRFLNLLAHATFSILLGISNCNAQEMPFQAFDKDAVFVVHTDETEWLIKSFMETGLADHSEFQAIFSELDEAVNLLEGKNADNPDNDSPCRSLLSAIQRLLGDESVTVVGCIHRGKLEIAIVCNSGSSSIVDVHGHLVEITSAIRRFSLLNCDLENRENERGFDQENDVTTKKDLISNTTPEGTVLDFAINTGFGTENQNVFFTHSKSWTIVSTSEEVAESILKGLTAPSNKNLTTDRTFLATKAKLESSNVRGNLWFYFTPRVMNSFSSVDSFLTFDLLLPEFLENVGGITVSNHIAGLGARILLVAGENDSPSVVVDGFIRTTLPRSGIFTVLDDVPEIKVPPVRFDNFQVESLQCYNIDFSSLFQKIVESYDLQNGQQSWAEKSIELKEHFKNTFFFDDLFDAVGTASFSVWLRGPDNMLTGTSFLQFKSSEDASWYAREKSNSGFLNQTFPNEQTNILGFEAFERSNEMIDRYKARVGSSGDSGRTFLVMEDWMAVSSSGFARHIAENYGQENRLLSDIEGPVLKIQEAVGLDRPPFFLSYRQPRRWAPELGRLRNLLTFEEKLANSGIVGVHNAEAPQNLWERVVMTARFRLTCAWIETMGETVHFFSADDDSVRFSLGCFSPNRKVNYSKDLPKIKDHFPLNDK